MEEQQEKSKRSSSRYMGLVYIIAVTFIALLVTAYFLQNSMEEVKTLQSHKKVLINRLAEEVHAKKLLQHRADSLEKYLDATTPVAGSVSSDVQKFR